MEAELLERYLARTGYQGPRAPTLDVLHALTAAHSKSIPFENLDVLLGKGIDIAPEAVFTKLVEQRPIKRSSDATTGQTCGAKGSALTDQHV